MAEFESVVVGYRRGSRRIQYLRDEFGIHAVAVRKCLGDCGYDVYFFSGGIDAAREKDSAVICEECRERLGKDGLVSLL